MQSWFFKKTLCLVNLKKEAARLIPAVTYRPRVHWSVKILPKKNLYDSIKLKPTSTSSSSWKENRKGHGSKYLIIKCDKDLIRVIFQEYLLTGLWLLYVSNSSNIWSLCCLYNKWAINLAMSFYKFFPFFPSHEGGMPRFVGAKVVLCSAQTKAVAGMELRAVIQPHFNAKFHWQQEESLGILKVYFFLNAVLVGYIYIHIHTYRVAMDF